MTIRGGSFIKATSVVLASQKPAKANFFHAVPRAFCNRALTVPDFLYSGFCRGVTSAGVQVEFFPISFVIPLFRTEEEVFVTTETFGRTKTTVNTIDVFLKSVFPKLDRTDGSADFTTNECGSQKTSGF
jgi:hypothetical protein